MPHPRRLPILAAALAGTCVLIFGSYLLYEKVGLALLRGVASERVGLIHRADEPTVFWISVLTNSLFGLVLLAAGAGVLLAAVGKSGKR